MGRDTTQPQDRRAARPPARHAPPPVTEAEAALVLHYGRLARLAYTILPGSLDRHRRVLSAHSLVQQALPNRLADLWNRQPAVPEPRRSADPRTDPAYTRLRATVLGAALAAADRAPRTVHRVALLPRTWGLTLFPTGGDVEGMALERALAELSPTERAAYALITLEGLAPAAARKLLRAVGVTDPAAALQRAAELAALHPVDALAAADFDPCTVHARPTDLLRRRRRGRTAAAVAGALAAVAALLAVTLPGDAPDSAGVEAPIPAPSGPRTAFGVADLVRVPADAWRRTARIDFSAWPARGDGTGDQPLLGRALALWSDAGRSGVPTTVAAMIRTAPGTVAAAPVRPPRLLWSGHLDGAQVVLLDDGSTLARYTRPDHSDPGAADRERLELTRSDQSDVTSAGAVLLRSTAAGDRFLLAPWVDTAQLRDLRAPDTPAGNLAPVDGLTAAIAAPPASGCAHWPVLQLRSSPVIAEHHAFLLTDLGGITATHLTFTPPPGKAPANYPREATGPDALLTWARLGCTLAPLRGEGVKAVNAWEFALQALPEGRGTAAWTCTRADRWNGTGSAATQFLAPAPETGPVVTTAVQPQGRSCSRYEQYVVADTWWRSPASGRSYLLAAGSRHIVSIGTSGSLTTAPTATPDHTLALPEPRPGPGIAVTGTLDTGTTAHTLR